MSPKNNIILGFIKTLPRNIFSGFVVSLIALPLGLGLAMASDAPPISGIIAAIVGGIVVSVLGGSYVSITGPGNGLVGVLLVAIAALGINNTYAAIICSGVLLLVLGFLRMGKLADFFPSSAIQGMLAAIGLIILGKQFHIMLGNRIIEDNSFGYLMEIPKSIINVFSYSDSSLFFAAFSGIASLGMMVFYSKLRNKVFQLIPAPMWIVIFSICFSYYFELVLNKPNPINPEYMLSGIPSFQEIITQIPTPNFDKVTGLSFWSSVFALTLISSIESLLSIKAIDKLDPEKRRSNVNKDIKALGLATIGSGFLGGLNVVTVIARSSVNLNNGGSNRSSNFFHALFLVGFIILFSSQLERIPLPALMSILVYTGYKLASPKLVRNIFSIGKEQLIIFFITLFVTLKVGIISGIASGVLVTFIIHVFVNGSASLFLRNILKPNVLMFKEEENQKDNYYVSVKHFSSFLNFFRLKYKLDAIPEDKDVIIDFSMCGFVDHTVMENLNNYRELFAKRGGHFEIIGLDMHDTDSGHPFALRRLLPVPDFFGKNLTRRQNTIKEISVDFSVNYDSEKNKDTQFLSDFLFFKTRQINHIYNEIHNEQNTLRLFDIEFTEGEFIAKEVVRTTMLHIKIPQVPIFTLDKEGFLQKMYGFAGFKDIHIDNHKDFTKRFYLLGDDEIAVKKFFNDELVHFFESNPYFHIESNGNSLLIFDKERLASIREIKGLLDFGRRLQRILNKNIS